MGLEDDKRAAAVQAADLVDDGMRVGLGSGTTVANLLPALAARGVRVRCFASSPATEAAARAAGLDVEPFLGVERLEIAIDGADQITPDGWLIKGGGRAHTREKLLAAAAERFVVIAAADKLVERPRADPTRADGVRARSDTATARARAVARRAIKSGRRCHRRLDGARQGSRGAVRVAVGRAGSHRARPVLAGAGDRSDRGERRGRRASLDPTRWAKRRWMCSATPSRSARRSRRGL